jgi:hypothetical protein
MAAPAGVTALVLDNLVGISPDPQKTTTPDDHKCST